MTASSPITRVVLVPRWGSAGCDDFYPRLKEHIGDRAAFIAPTFLRPDAPRIREWVPVVLAQLWVRPEEVLVVAHSMGCQAALRAAARLPEGAQIGGFLAVAGWWTVDAPWPGLAPWMNKDFDRMRARQSLGERCHVMLSDNDPHTADWRSNQRLWQENLNATVQIVPGAAHFQDAEQAEVFTQVLQRLR